jgi:transposase, IS30 family
MNKKIKGKFKKNKRNFKQFTLNDRIKIELRYRDGWSMREIANELGHGREASSVCREIDGKPKKGVGKYQAHIAHEKALNRRKGKKQFRLKNELIRKYVVEKIKLGWSPEQIAIRLPIDHKGESISYEAIYQYVYAQVYRGGNGYVKEGCEDLRVYLPRRHTKRAKKGFRKAQKLERTEGLPSIEYRPAEVAKRKVVGHWEDDCIVSRQSLPRLKSVNERVSGVVLLGKMKDGTSDESTRVFCEKVKHIPSPYLKTLTRDRGSENMGWKDIEKNLGIKVFFAHAYCSSERGSNENLNGLVRRFFPKKTDFAKVTDEEIYKVEHLLNTRPRKRFGGKTPLEVLYELTGVAITY